MVRPEKMFKSGQWARSVYLYQDTHNVSNSRHKQQLYREPAHLSLEDGFQISSCKLLNETRKNGGSSKPAQNLSHYSALFVVFSPKVRQCSKWIFLTVIFVLMISPLQARGVGVCNGIPCANGGKQLVSNSIWGNCRCKCRPGFVGPYCQYEAARKRSAEPTSDDVLAERAELLNLIRQRLEELAERLEEEVEVNDSNSVTEDESDVTEDNLDNQEITVRTYNRPRRSWIYPDYQK